MSEHPVPMENLAREALADDAVYRGGGYVENVDSKRDTREPQLAAEVLRLRAWLRRMSGLMRAPGYTHLDRIIKLGDMVELARHSTEPAPDSKP